MDSIRKFFSYYNELGLIISSLVFIGFFGSRHQLGFFPGFALVSFVITGLSGCIWLAFQGVSEDLDDKFGALDKSIFYVVPFLFGSAIFTFIGSII